MMDFNFVVRLHCLRSHETEIKLLPNRNSSTAGERGIFDSSSKAEWAVLGWPFIFSNEVTNRLREIGHLDNDR